MDGGEFVIYEDQSLLVLNKPAGVIVNRSDTTAHVATLQDLVEKYLKVSYPRIISPRVGEYPSTEETFRERSGIVHRLDKETSGIILVAKNPEVFGALQKAFKEREVQKTYLALAHGRIQPAEGTINAPVGRQVFNRMRFGVVAGGREAVTFYKVVAYYQHQKTREELSLVELSPKTGRTHQIRVHLKYINHPIVSDELYAGRKTARNDRKELERVFLHAAGITFVHPVFQKEMSFVAPLPEELASYIHLLSKKE